MKRIFKVRHVPPELEGEIRDKTIHLVDAEDHVKRPIFKNNKVSKTKEPNSPWWTITVE